MSTTTNNKMFKKFKTKNVQSITKTEIFKFESTDFTNEKQIH